MFTTASDYDLIPYNIPNLASIPNAFQPYVDAKEEEILIKLLGRPLYNEFIAGLDALPDAYDSTVATVIGDQYVYENDIWEALTITTGTTPVEGADWELIEEGKKWLKLKNGAEYTLNDEVYYWDGMVKLLKPYIYASWLNDNFDSDTGLGIVQSNAENSTVISPMKRIVNAFNDFSLKAGTVMSCTYYSNFYHYDAEYFYGAYYSSYAIEQRDTLFGFLTINESDYTGFRFQDQGIRNIFNL